MTNRVAKYVTPKAPSPSAPKPTFREFANVQAADQWAESNYGRWEKSLTEAQRNAIEDYRHDTWKTINEGLRSPEGEASLPPSLREIVKQLDTALAKHRLPEGVTVFRSMDLEAAGIKLADLTPGAEILDKAFTSTSMNPGAIWTGQRLEIRVPKGADAAYINNIGEGNKAERELLIGRTVQRFKVIGFTNDAWKTIILEAILP